jgi:Outer membrane efflux protein
MMRRDARVLAIAMAAVTLTAAPIRAGQALTFEQIAALRRPHPQEVEAEVLLAEAAGAAVGGGSFVRDAPTGALKAGPRRPEQGGTESDLALELDLPLLTDRTLRSDLAGGLDAARDAMRDAGTAVALADLAAAYAQAWRAQAELELREQDLSVTQAWRTAVERRVEAGADPPYESILAAGEHDRALLDLLESRREVELAWGELARLADLDAEASPLDLTSLPGVQQRASHPTEGVGNVALSGIEARRELMLQVARARSAAASSRWAIAGDIGREGEEEIAHLGLAYRFPFGGERAAIASVRATAEAAAAAEAAEAAGDLRARLAAAAVVLGSAPSTLAPADYEGALRALESRLAEGKERASQVLPLRRQLLEAMLAATGARAARAQAAAELFFLDGGDLP